MSVMQEREMQLVSGTVAALVQKSAENFQVVVNPDGSQYNKNLWTKDIALVEDIRQRGMGQPFDFMCNVSHWTNNSGQSVRSLWIEAVGLHGTMVDPNPVQAQAGGLPGTGGGLPGPGTPTAGPGSAPLAAQQPAYGAATPQVGAQPVQAQAAAPDPDWQAIPPVVRDARIMRQTAMKCAVHILPHLTKDMQTVSGLEYIAERFVAYFMAGPQDADVQQALAYRAMNERATAMGQPGGGSEYNEGYARQPQPEGEETPPDWVQQNGPVAQDYNAGPAAQPTGAGSEDAPRGAYEGGFPS